MPQPSVDLPPLIERARLADLCRETAAEQSVQPATVEKDYYLTRLIWALAQMLGDGALLKGGTLLSKVDLGFFRMSEDVDIVLPGNADRHKRVNAVRMNRLRRALSAVVPKVGATLPFPHGERSERDAHVQWTVHYESEFGPQELLVEATLRAVLRKPRRTPFRQLLNMQLTRTEPAYCWALDEMEARAEKVRAAFTRRAIRDYYDLDALFARGKDFSSSEFVRLVDAKLAELEAPSLALQAPAFGMTESERKRLGRAARDELAAVLPVDAQAFDLEGMLSRFDALWSRRG